MTKRLKLNHDVIPLEDLVSLDIIFMIVIQLGKTDFSALKKFCTLSKQLYQLFQLPLLWKIIYEYRYPTLFGTAFPHLDASDWYQKVRKIVTPILLSHSSTALSKKTCSILDSSSQNELYSIFNEIDCFDPRFCDSTTAITTPDGFFVQMNARGRCDDIVVVKWYSPANHFIFVSLNRTLYWKTILQRSPSYSSSKTVDVMWLQMLDAHNYVFVDAKNNDNINNLRHFLAGNEQTRNLAFKNLRVQVSTPPHHTKYSRTMEDNMVLSLYMQHEVVIDKEKVFKCLQQPAIRNILTSWMFEVAVAVKLSTDVLLAAIHYCDHTFSLHILEKKRFQLVAIVSLHLATLRIPNSRLFTMSDGLGFARNPGNPPTYSEDEWMEMLGLVSKCNPCASSTLSYISVYQISLALFKNMMLIYPSTQFCIDFATFRSWIGLSLSCFSDLISLESNLLLFPRSTIAAAILWIVLYTTSFNAKEQTNMPMKETLLKVWSLSLHFIKLDAKNEKLNICIEEIHGLWKTVHASPLHERWKHIYEDWQNILDFCPNTIETPNTLSEI